MNGPTLALSEELHATKYRTEGETFDEAMNRIATTLADSEEHYTEFLDSLESMRFMPAGRVQQNIGAKDKNGKPLNTTPYNCFVSSIIEDSMESIMKAATEAAETMRRGGGIGYNFSRIRPEGYMISSGSPASGPLSFMNIFDTVCDTISSAGHRRGAQMGILNVDHPDIEKFIAAKANDKVLTNFNLSVGITDEFMNAVVRDAEFALRFEGEVVKWVGARALWDKIMKMTWDWAEPKLDWAL